MKQFERIHDRIKHKSFGKIRISKKTEKVAKNEIEVKNKKDTKSVFEEEERIANQVFEELKKKKLSKVGNIWEIRKKVIGGKKLNILATAIIDPISGKLVTSKQKIKEVTLQYCKDTLTNYDPHVQYEEEIRKKKESMTNILQENPGNFVLQRETFD